MPIIQLGQYFIAGVKWTNNEGAPMEPFQGALPTWVSDKPNVVECHPSTGNPGMVEGRGIKLGDSVLTATAPFDTGFGVQDGSARMAITVVEVVTPNGEIVLSYGDIRPVH